MTWHRITNDMIEEKARKVIELEEEIHHQQQHIISTKIQVQIHLNKLIAM